jgi:hypothetical protein
MDGAITRSRKISELVRRQRMILGPTGTHRSDRDGKHDRGSSFVAIHVKQGIDGTLCFGTEELLFEERSKPRTQAVFARGCCDHAKRTEKKA